MMAPGRGVHHGLEWNPNAPGKLLAQIEPHPLRFVQRGTANDGRGRPEIERYTELAGWGQGLSLFLTRLRKRYSRNLQSKVQLPQQSAKESSSLHPPLMLRLLSNV